MKTPMFTQWEVDNIIYLARVAATRNATLHNLDPHSRAYKLWVEAEQALEDYVAKIQLADKRGLASFMDTAARRELAAAMAARAKEVATEK